VTWEEVFRDARPINLPRGSADEDDNMGVILVRVEGDPAEGHNSSEKRTGISV